MKNLALTLILFGFLNPVFAGDYIWETPVSENKLANFATDLIQTKGPDDSYDSEKFDADFVKELNGSSEKVSLMHSILQGLEQISRDSIQSERYLLTTGEHGDYHPILMSSRDRRTQASSKDNRILNFVLTDSSPNNLYNLALSQLHTLSDSEYKAFADAFIQTLEKTQKDLSVLNALIKKTFTQKQIKQMAFQLARENMPPDEIQKRLIAYRRQVEKYGNSERAMNMSYAAHILFLAYRTPTIQHNTARTDFEKVLPLQFERMSTLMIRALTETSVYTFAQAEIIRESAKVYLKSEISEKTPKDWAKILTATYKSPSSIQAMTAVLNTSPSAAALSCQKIYSGH